MYFYDNCFSMMFLSDFWLQPCMNRWFAEMKSYQRRQAWFLCNWFFYFYASWANRVSKNSFRRLVYIVGAHFIYCWITILYIVGAHLYLMLEHISIHSHVHIYIWICRRRWSLTLFFYAQLSYVHHTIC